METLSHLLFRAGPVDRDLGAAAFGMMVGVGLEPGVLPGKLEAEIVWQERLMSNVGRLAVNGDGGMILASCYTLGIQRFDLHGPQRGVLSPRAARSRTLSPTSRAARSSPRPSKAIWP